MNDKLLYVLTEMFLATIMLLLIIIHWYISLNPIWVIWDFFITFMIFTGFNFLFHISE